MFSKNIMIIKKISYMFLDNLSNIISSIKLLANDAFEP